MASAPHTRPRFFIEEGLSQDKLFQLNAKQSHYLLHVMYAQARNPVQIFNEREENAHKYRYHRACRLKLLASSV